MHRRHLLAALSLPWVARAGAQPSSAPAPGALPVAASASSPYARLQGGVPHHLTPEQEAQRVVDSPAPAGPAGRWVARAALPIPRSEMAWATVARGRMHVVGGYGEGAVNRDYHHIYDPAQDRWLDGAPLPRGANHVAVASDDARVCAFGGFVEQNRRSDTLAYVYDIASDRWTAIAPLPRPRGAAAAVRARRAHPPDRRRLRAGGRARQRRLARGLRPEGRPLERAQGAARRARPRRLRRPRRR